MLLHHEFVRVAKKNSKKMAIIDRTTEKRVPFARALIGSLILAKKFKKYKEGYIGVMIPTSAGSFLSVIGVLMAGLIYYVKYVMGLPETAMGIIFPILIVTSILFIPVWVKIGVKLGKIKSYTIGLCILSIMLFSLFFTQSSQLNLFYVQIFLLGIGFSSFQLFPFSIWEDKRT